MREILVLRHAKSRWDEPDSGDHDRGLAPRGIEAAKRMGRLIRKRGWLPDRILCSTARRASATLELAMRAWPDASSIPLDHARALYLASPEALLAVVREQPAETGRLLLVGHNPGLGAFVQWLAGTGDAATLAAVAGKFPTAALARLSLEGVSWRDVGWGSGRLLDFVRPRDL